MNALKALTLLALLTIWTGCQSTSQEKKESTNSGMTEGAHRAFLHANDSVQIAFTIDWKPENGDTLIRIHNAEEIIKVRDIKWEKDSLTIKMPVFLSYFRMVNTESGMSGYWYNPDKDPHYKVACYFENGIKDRYPSEEAPAFSLYEKWRVQLYAGTEKESSALGEFFQEGNKVKGSILTETGDYRFLEGVISNDRLILSTFDGAHAYAFTAKVSSPSQLEGSYYSGKHFQTPWKAVRDDNFQLKKATEISKIDSKNNQFEFQFRDTEGELFNSNTASQLQDKVTIVQIMGSWCPNCMDETRYLLDLKKEFGNEGLQLVAITFERFGDWSKDKKAVEKMIKDLNIDYPVLYGGGTRYVQDSLPMLQSFRSYPTAIFLDREGEVRRVHTGFAGPGTSAFIEYAEETESFVRELLSE
jgi:thiol-disulfide isomerase/thioredoxin